MPKSPQVRTQPSCMGDLPMTYVVNSTHARKDRQVVMPPDDGNIHHGATIVAVVNELGSCATWHWSHAAFAAFVVSTTMGQIGTTRDATFATRCLHDMLCLVLSNVRPRCQTSLQDWWCVQRPLLVHPHHLQGGGFRPCTTG